MKTKVDTYKGFDIYFDSDNNIFVVEGEDSSKEKRSYPACKTYINDFIKENKLFGEFQIIKIPTKRSNNREWENHPLTVKGIHANGNFLVETFNGEKLQLSGNYEYDLKQYCLPEHLETCTYDQSIVDKLEVEISKLRVKIKEEEDKLPEGIYQLMKEVREEYSHLWK